MRTFLVALALTAALQNPASAGPAVEPGKVLDAPIRAIPGPKRTVAVSRFASNTDFNNHYGLSDIGGGLADLLSSALVESGQFIVVERPTLSDVLSEQKLAGSGLVVQEGAARAGNLIGASLLVKGAVTEFSLTAGGGGFGVGVAGFGLGVKSQKASIGLDIQVIDSTTGQVLSSFPIRETVSSKSVGIDVSKHGVSTGYSQFFATSIGQAARRAITKAVERFADDAARQAWTGRVVAFEGGEVVINAGVNSGIQVGDSFVVERASQLFTDPSTGRVLGQRKVRLGRVVVSAVDSEIAFGSFQPINTAAPMRGDLIVQ
jgi:curli biogenesis system outer membrane secretion channel CsgG